MQDVQKDPFDEQCRDSGEKAVLQVQGAWEDVVQAEKSGVTLRY